jgi:hypothetical protein
MKRTFQETTATARAAARSHAGQRFLRLPLSLASSRHSCLTVSWKPPLILIRFKKNPKNGYESEASADLGKGHAESLLKLVDLLALAGIDEGD